MTQLIKASDEHIASLCKLPGTTGDNDDNFTSFISTTLTNAVIINDSWNYCPRCGRRIYKK